jgi:hypothetical protein
VASSPVALLILLSAWVVLPTAFAVQATTDAVQAGRGGADAGLEWAVAVAGWIVAVPSWWVFQRLGRRSCVRLADGTGLLVRGFFRREIARWDEVQLVYGSESEAPSPGFVFSHTTLMVSGPAATRPRYVVVSASWRSGSAKALTVLGWLPPDHPLRSRLPADPQYASALPPRDVGAQERVRAATPTRVLRPQRAMRVLGLSFLAFAVTLATAQAIVSLSPYERFEGRTMVGIGWALLALVGLGLAASTSFARLELTPEGLVDHGPLRVSVYPVAEIAGFRVDPSGWGQLVRVVLVGRGSQRLFVSAGLGDHPDRVWAALDEWLESVRDGPGGGRLPQ